MCVDKGGMAWTMALVSHKDPPKGVIGFGYMLVTGSDPDNMDPFATKPPPGRQWVATGPHVMLLNVGDLVKDYPTRTTGYFKAVCDVSQYSIRAHYGSGETIRSYGCRGFAPRSQGLRQKEIRGMKM
jgi:hypothetical protein